MAYTLGNKCAKNRCKRIVLLIIENVVTCFFGTQCIVNPHLEQELAVPEPSWQEQQ